MTSPVIVAFSKDRAFQLDGLLRSMDRHITGACQVRVVWAAGSDLHRAAYRDLIRESPANIQYAEQRMRSDFRPLVISALSTSRSRSCLFLVDDQIVVEPIDLPSFAKLASPGCIPSLRLGANLRRAYTVDEDQPLPSLTTRDDGLLEWRWSRGVHDWAYPMSVDGNVFLRRPLVALLRTIPFSSPNELESRMQRFAVLARRARGVCFVKSRAVNIPANRVQSDRLNRHGDRHQDELAELWLSGFRLDVASLDGYVNESAHEEIDLPMVRP